MRVEIEGDPGNWQPFKIISMEAISGQCAPANIYRVYDWPGESLIYNSNTPPSNLSNCKFITVASNADFGSKEILWTME
jgi:hypothetical protein